MSNARSLASFLSGTPTTDFNFDSNSLVVDISENSVGIGTNAPGTSLELAADAESTIATIATYSDTNTHVPSLYLEKSHSDTLGTNTATVDDEYLGEIKFAGFSNDNTIVYSSTIRAVQDGSPSTSTIGTDLEFYTQANGSAMGDARMIIKSDGKVGIGTTAPEANLEIEGASAGLLFQLGAESGKNCGYMGFEHEGSHIGFIGGGAGLGSPASDDFVIRVETSTDMHFLRGTTEAMVLKGDSGNVGIGTTSPSRALSVFDNASGYVAEFINDGNTNDRGGIIIQAGEDTPNLTNYYIVIKDGNGSDVLYAMYNGSNHLFTTASDQRLKTDIKDTNLNGLETLNKIKTRDFKWKKSGVSATGFIAQELNEIYPEAVGGNEDDEDHVMSVSKEALVPVLVKAVQELSAKVKELENA